MPVRVSPTDRIRTKIDELFAEERELPDILEEVARLGAQLLMQAALEAEVTEFLGRERYQRATTTPAAADGSRNGYRPGDGEDHHWRGHLGAAETAGHHR
jgi:putative transposase